MIRDNCVFAPSLWIRISYTLFVAILIPIYWVKLGPLNFLWFSDIALILTVLSLWLRSPLINSMMFLSVVFFESFWIVDFLYELISGDTLLGLASYMFEPDESLTVRIFSGLFHVWMPLLIVYLLLKWGYDKRALLYQTILGWTVLLQTYLAQPEENINWVQGFWGIKGYTFGLEPSLYLLLLMLVYPLIIYLPIHLLLKRLFKLKQV